MFDQIPASGPISARARLFALVGSAILVLCMSFLVRKRVLKPAYSLLWLLLSFIVMMLAVFSELLFSVSQFFGIYYVPATLFLLALGTIFLVALHFSLVITKMEKRIAELTQIVALAKQKKTNVSRGKHTQNIMVKKKPKLQRV